ncbi:MAG: 3-hydroxyacyl-ACP dehydratase FabZ, partial [Pseudomonadota bacterium]
MTEQGAHIDAVTIDRIMDMIPHRYPMLLVDRVVDVYPDQSAVGIKNVTINEPFFNGHFPGHPIMPGVMIVEAMAQTAAVLVICTIGVKSSDKLVYFMSIEQARFRRPVTPGDTMRLTVKKKQNRRNVWKFEAVAHIDDQVCAEANFAA